MNRDATLPTRWAEGSFTDALEIIRGISFPTDAKSFASAPGLIACLRTTNVQRNVEWEDLWYVPEKYIRNPRQFVEPEDILISTANSLELVGKVAQISDVRTKATIGTFIMLLRPNRNLNPRFIFHQLSSAEFQEKIRATASTTTNISNVSGQKLTSLSILIASRREQDRIVEEIEKQFTRLDAAVAALKRIQANLKRYRAAVLKAACEGHLVPTEAELARREGRSYEPASVLLERILAERRSRWEAAQVSKVTKSKYREPLPVSEDTLPLLPEGWAWANWEQLSPRVTVGHVGPMKDEYVANGFPFLRSQNVRENRFDVDGLLHIPKEFHLRLSKSVICGGDLVVVRSGSVGTTCVVPDHLGEANCADLVIIKQPTQINSWYGCYYMNSSAKRYVHAGKVGVALTHFNTKSVAELPVALPPKPEQDRIVDDAQRRLSVIDEIEVQVEADLRRANSLRQAVLKRAFEG